LPPARRRLPARVHEVGDGSRRGQELAGQFVRERGRPPRLRGGRPNHLRRVRGHA
jgi:hypothetical protein